jgi:hypothetical protein
MILAALTVLIPIILGTATVAYLLKGKYKFG